MPEQHPPPLTGGMIHREAFRSRARSARVLHVTGFVAASAAVALLASRFVTPPSRIVPTPTPILISGTASAPRLPGNDGPSDPSALNSSVPDGEMALGPVRTAKLGKADGLLPSETTAFDSSFPGIGNLDPQLLRALRRATTAAAGVKVEILVSSGWRSLAYQTQLFEEAVAEYGSAAKAGAWVAPPGTSAHEAGEAVDIGPGAAAAWLSAHGARYGLCQTYRNEPWHYELRTGAINDGCPAMYADPTQDPRTSQ